MGLMEKIAEGREALNAELGVTPEPVVEEKPAEEVVVEQTETPVAPAEEDKPEPKTEEKPDNAAMAKMRREAAASRKAEQEAKAELERLRAETAQPKQQPETKVVDDPEPDQDDVEAHLKWQIRKQDRALDELRQWKNEQSETHKKQEAERKKKETYDGAIAEFTRLEVEFIKQAPDYEATTKHMHTRMTDAVKALYPSLTDEQAIQAANNQILNLASHYAQQHLNPVEELYYLAKDRYGLTATEAQPEPRKASVEKVAEVRKKAASSLGGGTAAKPLQMPKTPRELAALTPEQRSAYIKSLQK